MAQDGKAVTLRPLPASAETRLIRLRYPAASLSLLNHHYHLFHLLVRVSAYTT